MEDKKTDVQLIENETWLRKSKKDKRDKKRNTFWNKKIKQKEIEFISINTNRIFPEVRLFVVTYK